MGESFTGPHTSPWHERIVAEHEILRTQVGSGLHGVTIAGTDDRDEMGVCIEPPECVVGLNEFEQYIFRTQPEGQPVRSGRPRPHRLRPAQVRRARRGGQPDDPNE